MANRINKNLRWVVRQLNRVGITDVLEEEVLDAMNIIEAQLLKHMIPLKAITPLTFDTAGFHAAGIYDKPAATDHIMHIGVPSDWSHDIEVTYSEARYHEVMNEMQDGTEPHICLIFNNKLYFYPIPTSGSVTLYSSTMQGASTIQVEGTGDPIIGTEWDLALRYGALSILLPESPLWKAKYDEERQRAMHGSIQEAGVPLTVEHGSTRIGF